MTLAKAERAGHHAAAARLPGVTVLTVGVQDQVPHGDTPRSTCQPTRPPTSMKSKSIPPNVARNPYTSRARAGVTDSKRVFGSRVRDHARSSVNSNRGN